MKKCNVWFLVLGATACYAQGSRAGLLGTEMRQAAPQRQVRATSFTPRQLSAEQRAELRRQLSQYSRVAAKAP